MTAVAPTRDPAPAEIKEAGSALGPSAYPDCDSRCSGAVNSECVSRCVDEHRAEEARKAQVEADELAQQQAAEQEKAKVARQTRTRRTRRDMASEEEYSEPESPRPKRSLSADGWIVDKDGHVVDH